MGFGTPKRRLAVEEDRFRKLGMVCGDGRFDQRIMDLGGGVGGGGGGWGVCFGEIATFIRFGPVHAPGMVNSISGNAFSGCAERSRIPNH